MLTGTKKNNDISNLQVMLHTTHCSTHASERGRMCVDLRCPECGHEFTRYKSTTHLQKPSKLGATFCGPVCRGKFSARVKYGGLTEPLQNAIKLNVIHEYRRYL